MIHSTSPGILSRVLDAQACQRGCFLSGIRRRDTTCLSVFREDDQPVMSKAVFLMWHTEFAMMRQRDAKEFLTHMLILLRCYAHAGTRSNNTGTRSPARADQEVCVPALLWWSSAPTSASRIMHHGRAGVQKHVLRTTTIKVFFRSICPPSNTTAYTSCVPLSTAPPRKAK